LYFSTDMDIPGGWCLDGMDTTNTKRW